MAQSWKNWGWRLGWVGVWVLVANAWLGEHAIAQITPDATLGTDASRVTPNVDIQGVPGDRIDGGALRGTSLFHSFSDFNVGEGQRVYFANPASVANILSRVTGSNLSEILGTLGVDGGANLFLLNPNGIIFGENARLDVAGSFVASTANRLAFGNGVEFSATNPEAPPLLTLNVTPGLQYGSPPQGRIANAGNLAVAPGQTLTLLGTTVTSTGSLTAPGGTVQMLGDRVGLFENARIDVSGEGGGGTVLIGGDFQGEGEVPNASRTFVGGDVAIRADARNSGDGGRVIVWADEATRFYGRISARGGESSGNGGFVEVSGKEFLDFNGRVDTAAPNGVRGTLLLDPTNIEVVAGGAETNNLADVDAFADPDIGGDGDTKIAVDAINSATANVILQATNDITFNADVFLLNPGVGLTAKADNDIIVNRSIYTFEGEIQLVAGGDIFLTSVLGSVFSDGANVLLNAEGNLSLTDGAVVNTSGFFFGTDSGDIAIETGSLSLTNGAQLIANTSILVDSNAGDIRIQAEDGVSLSGEATGILSSVNAGIAGNGGEIEINARSLSLTDGAQVQSILFRTIGGGIPGGQGNSGSIRINTTDFVDISGTSANGFSSGLLTSSERGASGAAGDIEVTTGAFRIADGALVNSLTANVGDAGNVTVNANTFEAVGGGQILTLTRDSGSAGNITVNASDRITLSGSDPTFFDRLLNFGPDVVNNQGSQSALVPDAVSGSTGEGGNLTLNTRELIVTDGAVASASTFGAGDGGNVAIANFDRPSELVEVSRGGVVGSIVFEGATGNGGNVAIETEQLVVREGSGISTSTAGAGQAGDLRIVASESVAVSQDSLLSSRVEETGTGAGGELAIVTRQLTLQDRSGISTSTSGAGMAGNLTIQDAELVDVSQGSILSASANETATGDGGDLTLETGQLVVRDNSAVTASTSGAGKAGNLEIFAPDSVVVNRGSLLSTRVNESAAGDGGDLSLETGQLVVRDNSNVTASTAGIGQAGDLMVRASDSVEVSNGSILSAQVITNARGDGGDLTLETGRLVLRDEGLISAATFGEGRGGQLNITATDSVEVIGGQSSSGITTSTTGSQAAGDLTIATSQLLVDNAAAITSSTSGAGAAGNLLVRASDSVEVGRQGRISTSALAGTGNSGNLTIETGELTVRDGGQVGAGTFDRGDAATLTVRASDAVRLIGTDEDGNPSGIFASSQGEGDAGGLRIFTGELAVEDGAAASVSGSGAGNPGSLEVEARSIFLDRSNLEAVSASGSEANIRLQVSEIILMRNRSLISARAENDGSGGNIEMEADYVIAIPRENSDIVANAQEGPGGRIDITAQRIIGLEERDPLTPLSDINASSEFGFDGVTETTELSPIDPTRGLTPLPVTLVDPTQLIDRSCAPGGAALESSFVITGRGGIPTSPTDPLSSNDIVSEWVTLDAEAEENQDTETEADPTSATPKRIIEAQGWIKTPDGQIILVANAPTVLPQTPQPLSPSCSNY